MEPAINWNMGIIALGITIFLFVLNIIINPPYIPDKSKPAISCNEQGICEYPEKPNPFYICGPIFIILVLLCFVFFGQSFFAKKAYVMTLAEAYRKIPVEDFALYDIPSLTQLEPSLIVPKDSGKSILVRYKDRDGFSYMKLNLMSDFKNSATDFSRKSPLIAWTHLPLSPTTISQMMRSDVDTMKKLSELDRMAEQLMEKPITAEMWKAKMEAEKKRMESTKSGEEL